MEKLKNLFSPSKTVSFSQFNSLHPNASSSSSHSVYKSPNTRISKFEINQAFQTISDWKNKEEILKAMKKLRTVGSRVKLVDRIIKRQEEINILKEKAKISELFPVINKFKQQLQNKIKMKKNMQRVNIEEKKEDKKEDPQKIKENEEKKNFEEKDDKNPLRRRGSSLLRKTILIFKDKKSTKDRSPVKDFEKSEKRKSQVVDLNNGKGGHILTTQKNENYLQKTQSPKILSKFSKCINNYKEYVCVLEKDIYNFSLKNKDKFLPLSQCKSIENLELSIRNKMDEKDQNSKRVKTEETPIEAKPFSILKTRKKQNIQIDKGQVDKIWEKLQTNA